MINVFLTEKQKRGLANKIEDTNFEICSTSYFTEVLKHTTKSASVVAFGDILKSNVAVKISFARRDNGCDEMCVERFIYEHVISKLWEFSPNIIICYAISECDDFWKNIKNDISMLANIQKQSKILERANYNISKIKQKNQEYDFDTAHILLLEKIKGESLNFVVYEDPHFNSKDMLTIFFQIFYTLNVFNIAGLKHNDLHMGNILVQYSSTPFEIIYNVSSTDTWFKIRTHFLVKIFDFDRSWHPSLPSTMRNTTLCECAGECDGENKKYDTFKLLYLMYLGSAVYKLVSDADDIIIEFCESFIDKSLLKDKRYQYTKNLCKLQDSKNVTCPKPLDNSYCYGPLPAPPDNMIASTEMILHSQYFKKYQIVDKDEIADIKDANIYYTDK